MRCEEASVAGVGEIGGVVAACLGSPSLQQQADSHGEETKGMAFCRVAGFRV